MKIAVLLGLLLASACSRGDRELHAVGSIEYSASHAACAVAKDVDRVLKIHADHYRVAGGKGLVFEAAKPGVALIACGDNKLTINVREASRIALHRTDGTDEPASIDRLYAPSFCVVAFDKDGNKLALGRYTEGVEFTTTAHLSPISSHGMGGPGPGAACLQEHALKKAGTATISATWRSMTATASLEIR